MNNIATPEVMPLGGFPVIRSDNSTMVKILKARMQQGQTAVFFANTNLIVKCQTLREAMNKPDTVIVNDGIGLDIASWLIHRRRFIENLAGTDFIPEFLQEIKTDAKVFLFGGKPNIAQRAASILAKDFQIQVVGARNGYDEAKDTEKLIAEMNESKANIILVAMGNPYQEQWIVDHRHQLNASVLMGVGAFLDFLSGDKPRAPNLVRRLRLEWFYRLCLEPSRLFKRYTVDIAVFLRLCMQQGKSLR